MKIRNFIEKKNPIGLTNNKDTMETKFNSSLIEPLNTKINKSLEESEGEKNINLVDGVLSNKTQSLLTKLFESKKINNFKETNPEVSTKTLLLLEKLKEDRKNKFDNNKTKINEDSAISLRFKYNEFIQEKRELILPVVFKKLLLYFNELDSMVNFFKLKKKTPYFKDICSQLNISKKK